MKKNIFLLFTLLIGWMGVTSCSDDDYPANATIVSPISALVLSVEGIDYVAVPRLAEDGSLDHTLTIEVRKESAKAVVKSVHLADTGMSIDIAAGDEVSFENNRLALSLTRGSETESYFVEMVYNPPPFMYFIKTGDRGPEGEKYYINPESSQKIASVDYNDKYEGYIDLTATNWDNIGLVESGLSNYYDYNGGLSGVQSSASYVMVKKQSSGGHTFPCDGPWGNWTTTNGNTAIISPGIWKINFDAATRTMSLLETQWAVTGPAINASEAMTYASDTRKWSLTTDLSAGTLKFTTIPVNEGDPVITYGASEGISRLSEKGKDIEIAVAGNYTITLDLSQSPYYDYTIKKNK